MTEQKLVALMKIEKAVIEREAPVWYVEKEYINKRPTIDVVPVVRCRDCKYAHMTYDGECKYCDQWDTGDPLYLPGDYFCADGERR
jgi:lipopolysaccharide biosynthesis regulator YciM